MNSIFKLVPALALAAIAAASAPSPCAADSVRAAASSTTAVDVRTGACRAVLPATVGYSPLWGGVTNAGAYVVVEKVVGAARGTPVVTTLATFAAGSEGVFPLALGEDEDRCFRLVHRVFSASGVEVGEPLEREIALGRRVAAAGTAIADTRAESFQKAVEAKVRRGEPLDLTYDTAWNHLASSVSIASVRNRDAFGNEVAGEATNTLFSAAADAVGAHRPPAVRSGGWHFVLTMADANGTPVGEPYVAEYFIGPLPTAITLR